MWWNSRIIYLSGCLFTIALFSFSWSAQATLSSLKADLEDIQVVLTEKQLDVLLQQAQNVNITVYSSECSRLFSRWYLPLVLDDRVYYPLKYKNPEIVAIVLQAYISAVEREREYVRLLQDASASTNTEAIDGESAQIETGEARQDFYDMLADMAESTLSEKLYDCIWEYPQPSSFRSLYIAYVFPDRTIERFTTSTLGRTKNELYFAGDSLFPEGTNLGTSLARAFEHMADIVLLHPELAKTKGEELKSFVENFSLHYASRPSERYVAWRDYRVREAAMRILSQIGEREDLPLLGKLKLNAPVLTPSRRISNPRDLNKLSEMVEVNILGRE